MKKVGSLFAFCLALALAFSVLTACHGSRVLPSFVMPSEFDESKNYEITFWAKNDTNTDQVAVYNKAVRDFEALYPNVDVTVKFYTDYGRIYSDVITNIQTGTTPNVCITYPDHIATYMSGENAVVPLDELMADEHYGLGGSEVKFDSPRVDEIVPKFLDECKIDGRYYALPYMRSTEACYVNKTYVEALGYTLPDTLSWEFIFEVSAAATKKADDGTYLVNGQNVLIPFIYKSTDNMMIQWLKQLGADYSGDNGEILLFNDETENILYTVADSAKKGAFSTFKISSYPANFLNAGQCIFAIDSTAGATWMGAGAPNVDIPEEDLVDFETAVMTVPQCDAENPEMISQGPSVCIFNKEDPGEVLASWLFVQFLLTDDVQISYATIEGYVPVTTKARESQRYKDYLAHGDDGDPYYYGVKLEATKLLLDNIENTFVTPVFNGSTSLRDASGHLIESVVRAVRRGDRVDEEYMKQLFDDTASLYHVDPATEKNSAEKKELGELPASSLALILSICLIWIGIGTYLLCEFIKKRKNEKNST